MTRSVICISATDGAADGDIGTLVAERLGYRVVDEQVVARAAEEAGIEPAAVARVEQRRSLIGRLIDQLPAAAAAAPPMVGYVPSTDPDAGPAADELRGLIRSAIEELAERGSAVIVSHAASHALNDRPDVLRVLVTASADTRRGRLEQARGIDGREAGKQLASGDANRADYLKRFYGVAAEGPTDYDVVVNTDRLSAEEAAEIVALAAGAPMR